MPWTPIHSACEATAVAEKINGPFSNLKCDEASFVLATVVGFDLPGLLLNRNALDTRSLRI
jgi:hypothetical protein